MTFVVNVSAKFLMYLLASETRKKLALGPIAKFLSYLLASETRQYFGSGNDNNLSTILNEIKKMFLMETVS